MLENNINVT